ncbi:MAG TPA: ATP-binding cassette domain-containing protein [Solirubrobacterales bacterium]
MTTEAAPTGEVVAENLGVRFDFDRRSRVVTPALSRIRRIRASAWGLRGIDLHLEPGDGVALVGPTGSGKTTMLRVLAGVIPPDEGTVRIRGRVSSLLATEAGVGLQLTGRENAMLLAVLAGLSHAEASASMDLVGERARLEVAFDRPIHTYSEGMRARLHFAVIQAITPQMLLLDEVFEALDHEFRGLVAEYAARLRERGGIVVAAGHDHPALDQICQRAVWLDRGHLRREGPIDEVISAYRETT